MTIRVCQSCRFTQNSSTFSGYGKAEGPSSFVLLGLLWYLGCYRSALSRSQPDRSSERFPRVKCADIRPTRLLESKHLLFGLTVSAPRWSARGRPAIVTIYRSCQVLNSPALCMGSFVYLLNPEIGRAHV